MKQSQLKQLIKEQILAEVEAVSPNQQIYGFNVNGERIEFKLDEYNELHCYKKDLKTLIVNNPQVKRISCYENQLATLKLGRLSNLIRLSCWSNNLTNLNLSGCSNLQELDCSYNNLTSLDISRCPKLKDLSCYTNQLVNLNLSKCPNLKNLDCYNNNLTTLDISMCPNLKDFDLDYDEYKTKLITAQELNEVEAVSHNQQIYGFNVNGERIEFKLDKHNDLVCKNLNLKTLIINNPKVEGIFCNNNQLTTLKLSRLPNLETLYCNRNQLTNLNLSGCSNLKNLECSYNKLTSLNISKCPNLRSLFCEENYLTSLDVSKCPKLSNLHYDEYKTQLI
jgi:Leucine-rich repeat (LRR) protein